VQNRFFFNLLAWLIVIAILAVTFIAFHRSLGLYRIFILTSWLI